MVQYLTELYVVEGKIHRLGLSSDSSLEVFSKMHQKMAEKTGIPDSVFRRSLQYYAQHPVELDRIYGALVDSLNLKEQRSSLQKE
jgi:cAMP phosphodiesterase